ncbi:MAG TPA: nuclear transport factor 2 family protein [Bryobacteraceae bacterium]|jgi:hypothetical protein
MDAPGQTDAAATEAFIARLRHFSSGDGYTGKLLSAESLDRIAGSSEICCPRLRCPPAALVPVAALNRALEDLARRNLDWPAIREAAARLSQEVKTRRPQPEPVPGATGFIPVANIEDRLAGLVRRWAAAWSSRNLESLLALFCDDGTFTQAPFGLKGSGKPVLRTLFARAFHTSNLILAVNGVKPSGDSFVLRWSRTGTRLYSVDFPADRYDFRGHSTIELRSDRIAICEESWDVTNGVMHVLMTVPSTRPPTSPKT